MSAHASAEFQSSGGFGRTDVSWLEVLGGVRAGTAGPVVVVAGNAPWRSLPHVGTSPVVLDKRAVARQATGAFVPRERGVGEALRNLPAFSVAEQACEVLAALSLNKSQLAAILGVSRPTLYEWLDGKAPTAANAHRLATILRLLATAGVTGSTPLHARFVHGPLSQGQVLAEALRSAPLDQALVLSLIREAKGLGERSVARRNAREDRLRALGFEEPSTEERRENLARSVAMRDWPKK